MEFHTHLGQTSPYPLGIEIERAEGIYIYDKQGNAYADLISGIAVSSLGHGHPKILRAIHAQVDRHLHTMVYGEFIQDAQMNFAEELLALLPSNLQSVYPVNSGTEAIEAAMKLTKRATGRHELIAFKGSYHGSTQGSMSISYNELKKTNYRPLLPGVTFIGLNDWEDLANITVKTAGVFLETVQGDAGVRIPDVAFLQALRERCTATGTLLVFDEIQCGLGRTGRHFAFEHFGVIPDVLVLGKALGGGMPIGALVTSQELMSVFKDHPKLGHITTFGGHPVACSAAAAFLQVLKSEINFDQVEASASIFRSIIGSHPEILEVRNLGLMFAFDMASAERVERVVMRCLEKRILTFWFLSHPYSFRLAPPLTITPEEARYYAQEIYQAIEETKA
ncbi:MAG: aspartate aminotransferase family protein [Flavobacteriia bacterium]|jgi:acetylornithine/succinyldiaminopimelate/putrescine aminotransferase|nr:aspartate aminotransferase family protein [Flavobacteriia bacterium]NBP30007.1 aspartate aminotransferase family protein [Flavobacteriia bacterium]